MTEKQDKVIELKNVGVTYKERKSLFKSESYQALKDISFDVYKGETLGIIGRNGAGKSTLLRLLAGIIKPDNGKVIHHCKSVSLMALAAGFDPNLSGRQNALISGMLIGHSKKEMQACLEDIKEFSELNDFFEKPVKTYSSGMRARLGFATAMHTHPDVLLIDEVLAVGDSSFKAKAESAIKKKIGSEITVILVSHSEAQLKALCSRIVWIEGGVVIQESDNTQKVLNLYRTNMRFSASGTLIEDIKLLDQKTTFWFEKFESSCSGTEFKCVAFNRNNKEIEQLKVIPSNVILSGPTDTPYLGRNNPQCIYSSKARYHQGHAHFDDKNTILMTIDGQEIPLIEFKIKKV